MKKPKEEPVYWGTDTVYEVLCDGKFIKGCAFIQRFAHNGTEYYRMMIPEGDGYIPKDVPALRVRKQFIPVT